MVVEFIKEWKNERTGSIHKKGSFNQFGRTDALRFIEDGFCKERPEYTTLMEAYRDQGVIKDFPNQPEEEEYEIPQDKDNPTSHLGEEE